MNPRPRLQEIVLSASLGLLGASCALLPPRESDKTSHCEELCEDLAQCGLLPSAFGDGRDTCERRCGLTKDDLRKGLSGCRPSQKNLCDERDGGLVHCWNEEHDCPALRGCLLNPDGGSAVEGASAEALGSWTSSFRFLESDASICDSVETIGVKLKPSYGNETVELTTACQDALTRPLLFEEVPPGPVTPIVQLYTSSAAASPDAPPLRECWSLSGEAQQPTTAPPRSTNPHMDPAAIREFLDLVRDGGMATNGQRCVEREDEQTSRTAHDGGVDDSGPMGDQ